MEFGRKDWLVWQCYALQQPRKMQQRSKCYSVVYGSME